MKGRLNLSKYILYIHIYKLIVIKIRVIKVGINEIICQNYILSVKVKIIFECPIINPKQSIHIHTFILQ